MKELSVGEAMRYLLAGGICIFALFMAFAEAQSVLLRASSNLITASAAFSVSLILGATIYSFHRALPYPLIYGFLTRIMSWRPLHWLFGEFPRSSRFKVPNRVQVGITLTTADMDIERWQRQTKNDSLQPRFKEWADQIHLLYCLAWACIGLMASWEPVTENTPTIIWLIGALLFSLALHHHLRYLRFENQVANIEHDSSIIAELQSHTSAIERLLD